MFPVDPVTAGPAAVSLSAPPLEGAPAGAIDFAQVLTDAQGAEAADAGGADDLTSATPERGQTREVRGNVRLAAWLTLGRATAPAAASAPIPALGDNTQPVPARPTDATEAIEAVEATAASEEHGPDIDTPLSIAVPVPAAGHWSIPVWPLELPHVADWEQLVQPDLTIAQEANASAHAALGGREAAALPPDAAAHPSDAGGVLTDASRPAPSRDAAATLPRELNQEWLDVPRSRAEGPLRDLQHASATTAAAARPAEQPWPVLRSEPDAVVRSAEEPVAIEAGVDDGVPAIVAKSERRPEALGPSQLAYASPAARVDPRFAPTPSAQVRRADPPILVRESIARLSTLGPRGASDDHADPVGALAVKRLREAHSPSTASWQPAPVTSPVVDVPRSTGVVTAISVGTVDATVMDDLRSQIVQAVKVQWNGAHGDARIRLQPHYLGELTISLRVEQGVVSAQLSASSPEVRQWIEANEVLLRQGLAQHDLKLDRLVVVKEEPAAPFHHEQEAEPRDRQPSRRRARQSATDATFEVVV